MGEDFTGPGGESSDVPSSPGDQTPGEARSCHSYILCLISLPLKKSMELTDLKDIPGLVLRKTRCE